MDLRDIEYFATVAQHGHLGRAAEALGLGQPALSMSLRRLEASAQAKLVKRTPKGVELTTVGAALLAHAGKLRLARDDLAREVADLAHGRAGHLRIGASPSNSEQCLPQACSALLMQAPKVTLHVAVLGNDALLPALRRGEIDIALTHTQQVLQPDITQEVFRHDEFVVYSAARHRLARRKRVGLADLAPERWAISAAAAAPDRPGSGGDAVGGRGGRAAPENFAAAGPGLAAAGGRGLPARCLPVAGRAALHRDRQGAGWIAWARQRRPSAGRAPATRPADTIL